MSPVGPTVVLLKQKVAGAAVVVLHKRKQVLVQTVDILVIVQAALNAHRVRLAARGERSPDG